MTQTRPTAAAKPSRPHSLRLIASSCALLALAGCVSTPKAPDAALQAAKIAISHAETARSESGTSPELREARDKLAAARSAVVRKDMLQAERLAQESRVAAELAFAKAEADKAAAINADMRTSIDALKVEMQRNAGDPQ